MNEEQALKCLGKYLYYLMEKGVGAEEAFQVMVKDSSKLMESEAMMKAIIIEHYLNKGV